MAQIEARRIAHVISTTGGIAGAENVLLALLEGGAERGWRQFVLNPSEPDGRTDFAERAGELADYRAAGGHYGTRRLVSPLWVWRHLRSLDPTLIQAMLPEAGALVGFLPRAAGSGIRTLSHQHGDHFVSTGRRAAAALDCRAGRRFDSVIACSRATAAFLREDYGYPPGLVTAIPNGWAGRPLRRTPTPRPTVVSVARLRAQKGHADLVAAFAEVLRRIPEARLVLVGDGPEEAAIRAQIDGLGIGGSVQLAGARDNVWESLATADVFALASHYEPLGIAALEAMAAGLPIVATAAGGLPEVIGDGGLLVAPGDRGGLAEKIAQLLTDPELATSLAANARARAEGRTMKAMVDAYFSHYEALLGAGPVPAETR